MYNEICSSDRARVLLEVFTGEYRAERRANTGGVIQSGPGHTARDWHRPHERAENIAHSQSNHFLGRIDHFSAACNEQ